MNIIITGKCYNRYFLLDIIADNCFGSIHNNMNYSECTASGFITAWY